MHGTLTSYYSLDLKLIIIVYNNIVSLDYTFKLILCMHLPVQSNFKHKHASMRSFNIYSVVMLKWKVLTPLIRCIYTLMRNDVCHGDKMSKPVMIVHYLYTYTCASLASVNGFSIETHYLLHCFTCCIQLARENT